MRMCGQEKFFRSHGGSQMHLPKLAEPYGVAPPCVPPRTMVGYTYKDTLTIETMIQM